MNRIDRLHAIAVHLQSKKRVTAQELADRFELSLRTVYRDIKALDESGVPVIGEAGMGYTIMEGYRLPPLMFTREEATALLLGTKFAEGWTSDQTRKYFESALFKIKAILRNGDKEHVEELSSTINIAPSKIPVEQAGSQFLFVLQQALAQKKVVRLDYLSHHPQASTTRDVEPIGIAYYSHCWHLIAWCRMRKDYRDFRMSRIQKIHETEEVFEGSQHISVDEYIKQVLAQIPMQEMIVEFDSSVVKYLAEVKYYYGFVSEESLQGKTRMKFLVGYPDTFARWLLGYTNAIQVVSPVSLRDILRQLATELIGHH